MRLLAREDLRHLLKHKRMYCPQALTPVERRAAQAHTRGCATRGSRTGKPVYRFVTRRLLNGKTTKARGRSPETLDPPKEIAMTTLSGKTLFITGASRGIGLAIALRAARDGANIAIAAKSAVPNPEAARHHPQRRGRGRSRRRPARWRCNATSARRTQVRAAVAATVDAFGGIDILVNNASAIWLRGTLDTPMKRFDLMQQVNARGSFLCAQACLPHLLQAPNPHILTLAPPPSPGSEMVGAAHRLHAGEDGHELRDARAWPRNSARRASRSMRCGRAR